MPTLFIFGLGYSATVLAARLRSEGWEVHSTGRAGTMSFDDGGSVRLALANSTHILSSVPPLVGGDPVLQTYGDAIRAARCWTGYLSSTGVYGDTQGAWVDEGAPIRGRRESRNQADRDWQALGASVFRLPGIYGPDRSAFDRVREGKAQRIDLPRQVFSRIHVDDLVSGVIAGFGGPPGVYNLSDDTPCSQNRVIEAACDLLRLPHPPMLSLGKAELSPMARAFYAENRRVSNGKAKRILGWAPRHRDFREGLSAINFAHAT
jgi:nucleoside-diphosphate-sugar epimerase